MFLYKIIEQKHLFLLLLILLTLNANAQSDKTVTLVVSGQGKTKDEAKQNALRSAIEQAFGTFISSKTEILNDNLVKDEIVSVASGNIQKYEIISEVQIPNGDFATSLNATVSVDKLTAFVESKGVVAEFKGSILAANVKQQMLNEKNEVISIKNISSVCKEILDKSCDYEIQTGTPTQQANDNNQWAIPLTINININKNIEQFNQYFLNSIKSLSMTSDETTQYKQLGKKTYKIAIGGINNGGTSYILDYVEYMSTTNIGLSYKILQGSEELFESDDFAAVKIEYNRLKKTSPRGTILGIKFYDKSIKPVYHFRNLETIVAIIDLIYYTKHSLLNFEITNGIDVDSPIELINDRVNEKSKTRNGFKIIKDNFSPIFNTFCNYYSTNGPNSLFGTIDNYNNTCVIWPAEKSNLYKSLKNTPINDYYEIFKYVGKINSQFDEVLKTKYSILQLPEFIQQSYTGNGYDSESCFSAVISIYDFLNYKDVAISFFYNDILTLSEVEKVQQYKITPIIKN